jgi:hypothetical protein
VPLKPQVLRSVASTGSDLATVAVGTGAGQGARAGSAPTLGRGGNGPRKMN